MAEVASYFTPVEAFWSRISALWLCGIGHVMSIIVDVLRYGRRLRASSRQQVRVRVGALAASFNPGRMRVRKNHGDQNLAALRRIALGLLRCDTSVKLGAKNRRLKSDRNREYLLRVLLSSTVEAK